MAAGMSVWQLGTHTLLVACWLGVYSYSCLADIWTNKGARKHKAFTTRHVHAWCVQKAVSARPGYCCPWHTVVVAYSVQQGLEGILPASAVSDGPVTFPGACVCVLPCCMLPGFFLPGMLW